MWGLGIIEHICSDRSGIPETSREQEASYLRRERLRGGRR